MTGEYDLLPGEPCHGCRVEENRAGVFANGGGTGVGDTLAAGTLLN